MLSTMSHDFGDIVLVRFPFTDQRGAKRRPAVVISTSEYHHSRPDVILAAVTSRLPNSQHELDLPIRHWDVAGLAKASAVKPIVFTAERAIMTRKLGRLVETDRQGLASLLVRMIGPQ